MSFRILIELASQLQGKGFSDAAKGLADTDAKARRLSLSVGDVGSMVRKLAVALTGGAFATFIKQSINLADELSKDAQAAGQTVTAFTSLAYAGDLSRASSEQLIQASKGLSQWLDKTGQSTVSLTQALLQQADVFAAMPDGPEKVRLANERFGRGAQQLIPLLNSGGEAIRAQMREAQQFGLVVGPKFSQNAQQFNDNLTRIAGVFRGMANMLAARLLPILIKVSETFIAWVKNTGSNQKLVDAFVIALQTLGTAFNGVVSTAIGASFAVGAFFQSLSEGEGPIDSVTEAVKAFGEVMDKAAQRDRDIYELTKSIGEGLEADPKPYKEQADAVEALTADLAKLETMMAMVESSNTMSASQKRQALIHMYQEQLKLLKQLQIETRKAAGVGLDEEYTTGADTFFSKQYAEIAPKLEQIEQQMIRIEELRRNLSSKGFFGQLSEEIEQLTEQFDDLGASVAHVLMDGVRGAIRVVSEGIWDVIDGTATWGDLFRQVGRQIISGLIQIAIQEIFLDNLKKTLLTGWAAMKAAFTAKDVAASNAAEAAKTPALATNATLASISSWGIAVAIGVAAIAGIMASMGAFERGGVVEGGEQVIRVNESGTEAVLNAGATARIGRAGIDAINSGMPFLAPGTGNRVTSALTNALGMESAMAAAVAAPSAVVGSGAVSGAYPAGSAPATGGASGAGIPIQLTLVIVDDRNSQAALDAIASSAGQALIVKAVKDQKMQVGIRA